MAVGRIVDVLEGLIYKLSALRSCFQTRMPIEEFRNLAWDVVDDSQTLSLEVWLTFHLSSHVRMTDL